MARPHTRRRVGNTGDAGVEAPPLNRKPSSRDKRRSADGLRVPPVGAYKEFLLNS